MKIGKLVIITLFTLFLLNGCELFQTVDTPIPSSPKALTAQEKLNLALTELYHIHSGSFVENFKLTFYRSNQDLDQWNFNIRENWQDNPQESLADIHITLTLPPASSSSKPIQGLINVSLARHESDVYFKLSNAHFAGPDAVNLDTVLQPFTEQWFQLPPDQNSTVLASSTQAILAFLQEVRSLPKETVTQLKLFDIQDVTAVQTDSGIAEKFNVRLNTQELRTLSVFMPESAELRSMLQNLITSTSFQGSLLIGKDDHILKQIDGIFTIQAPTSTEEKIEIRTQIELANINQAVPIAVPSQALPFPSEEIKLPVSSDNDG